MKDFIEALKKHGYKIGGPHELSNNVTYIMDGDGKPIVGFYANEGKECAFLVLWCLDEIERLGWDWDFSRNSGRDARSGNYFISCDRIVDSRLLEETHGSWGKTKTEACCNALVAVLEAK